MVRAADLPNYGEVVEDTNGNAIIPVDFLPGIVQNLPDEWYYDTYRYYPYFDSKQRDGNGNISIPPGLTTAMPANVNKWKECTKLLGDHTFKETGKLEYGYEICRMISANGYNLGPCRVEGGGEFWMLNVHPP